MIKTAVLLTAWCLTATFAKNVKLCLKKKINQDNGDDCYKGRTVKNAGSDANLFAIFGLAKWTYTGQETNDPKNFTLITIEDITATKGQSWEVWSLGSPGVIISDPINTYVPPNEASLLFKLVGTSSAVEGDDAGLDKKRCPKIMKKGGISKDFPKHVSHAIHSLTVEDIRMYFTKKAGENNKIPVVNPLLRKQPRVLKNAPYMNYDDEFVTDGMRHFDVIMQGINMDGWHLTSFELLESLSHVYHMSEIWANAGKKYKKVAKRLKVDSDLCDCVRDMEGNGLAKYLELTAFQIRYPGITSGNKTITDSYKGGFLDYHISYGLQERPKNIINALMDFDFNGTDEELINGVVDELTDEAGYDAEPHDPEDEARHSREHWEWCKGELKGLMTPELIYDTAVFMRCQLNLE